MLSKRLRSGWSEEVSAAWSGFFRNLSKALTAHKPTNAAHSPKPAVDPANRVIFRSWAVVAKDLQGNGVMLFQGALPPPQRFSAENIHTIKSLFRQTEEAQAPSPSLTRC